MDSNKTRKALSWFSPRAGNWLSLYSFHLQVSDWPSLFFSIKQLQSDFFINELLSLKFFFRKPAETADFFLIHQLQLEISTLVHPTRWAELPWPHFQPGNPGHSGHPRHHGHLDHLTHLGQTDDSSHPSHPGPFQSPQTPWLPRQLNWA